MGLTKSTKSRIEIIELLQGCAIANGFVLFIQEPYVLVALGVGNRWL